MDYISLLEKALGKQAKKEFFPMQKGDVPDTWADVEDLASQFGYKPATPVAEGGRLFAQWYMNFYKVC
jgi:UDP-glucuronate 4-epimerase